MKEGESAMHYASEITRSMTHYATEDADMIRLLLEYGGEVNVATTLVRCENVNNSTTFYLKFRLLDSGNSVALLCQSWQ